MKLKYQLIDTSFIKNQYGFSKNMGRNVQYKSKQGRNKNKLSC